MPNTFSFPHSCYFIKKKKTSNIFITASSMSHNFLWHSVGRVLIFTLYIRREKGVTIQKKSGVKNCSLVEISIKHVVTNCLITDIKMNTCPFGIAINPFHVIMADGQLLAWFGIFLLLATFMDMITTLTCDFIKLIWVLSGILRLLSYSHHVNYLKNWFRALKNLKFFSHISKVLSLRSFFLFP